MYFGGPPVIQCPGEKYAVLVEECGTGVSLASLLFSLWVARMSPHLPVSDKLAS